MKQKIYYTNKKFNEITVKLCRNLFGNVVVYVTDNRGNNKTILCLDTNGLISLPKFKRGENKHIGFRLDRKGNIKQE